MPDYDLGVGWAHHSSQVLVYQSRRSGRVPGLGHAPGSLPNSAAPQSSCSCGWQAAIGRSAKMVANRTTNLIVRASPVRNVVEPRALNKSNGNSIVKEQNGWQSIYVIRAATDRVCPRPDAGQGLRRAARETAPATSRRPPIDLVASHKFRLFARRNCPLRLPRQDLESCCIRDSVESVEQPRSLPDGWR